MTPQANSSFANVSALSPVQPAFPLSPGRARKQHHELDGVRVSSASDFTSCNYCGLGPVHPSFHVAQIESLCCLLRGRAHEALQNRARAAVWYRAALRRDARCVEALDRLIGEAMVPPDKGRAHIFGIDHVPKTLLQVDCDEMRSSPSDCRALDGRVTRVPVGHALAPRYLPCETCPGESKGRGRRMQVAISMRFVANRF